MEVILYTFGRDNILEGKPLLLVKFNEALVGREGGRSSWKAEDEVGTR